MSDDYMPVRPELLHIFGGRFCADAIDIRDGDELLFLAECVALDALDAGLSPQDISAPLQDVLERWTPGDIEQFSDANNGAWDFDEQCEQALKDVLRRIIRTANGGETSVRTVTPEEYLRMREAGTLNS